MKKIILSLLAALGCSTSMMAQTDDNALRINFTGEGNPIETEHLLEGTHITFSNDGEQMNLTVNGATATYNLSIVSGMSHFNGTPTVSLHANQDPDANTPSFYTTFYSGLEAYTLPEGVKAYKAMIEVGDAETVVKLTAIEGNVLPKGEAVLLYSDVSGDIAMTIIDNNDNNDDDNQFCGVDVQKAQEDYGTYNFYMLSYGQKGLGFYRMSDSMMLSANKAFIAQSPSAPAKAMRMVFADEETGIFNVNVNDNDTLRYDNDNIYSISGVRLNKLQKGINIVNGKKVLVK